MAIDGASALVDCSVVTESEEARCFAGLQYSERRRQMARLILQAHWRSPCTRDLPAHEGAFPDGLNASSITQSRRHWPP